QCTPWIEVVTGPKAERLILSVHLWLTEQAGQEKITVGQLLNKLSQSSRIKMIFDCVCPTCGKMEGPFCLGQSIWFYCREHKVKWLAGYDLRAPATSMKSDWANSNISGRMPKSTSASDRPGRR